MQNPEMYDWYCPSCILNGHQIRHQMQQVPVTVAQQVQQVPVAGAQQHRTAPPCGTEAYVAPAPVEEVIDLSNEDGVDNIDQKAVAMDAATMRGGGQSAGGSDEGPEPPPIAALAVIGREERVSKRLKLEGTTSEPTAAPPPLAGSGTVTGMEVHTFDLDVQTGAILGSPSQPGSSSDSAALAVSAVPHSSLCHPSSPASGVHGDKSKAAADRAMLLDLRILLSKAADMAGIRR